MERANLPPEKNKTLRNFSDASYLVYHRIKYWRPRWTLEFTFWSLQSYIYHDIFFY